MEVIKLLSIEQTLIKYTDHNLVVMVLLAIKLLCTQVNGEILANTFGTKVRK